MLHVAARLSLRGSKRETGHSTRRASTMLFHLPIEIWHHVLSFLKRSDMDHTATARDRDLLQTAAINDIFAYDYSYRVGANIQIAIPPCPLKYAVLSEIHGNIPWEGLYDAVLLILKAPSARDGTKDHEVSSLICALLRTRLQEIMNSFVFVVVTMFSFNFTFAFSQSII